jgi:phosphohistidine phosphatase SixA
MKRFVFCCLLVSALVATATAQSTVFIVRHAERADASADSDLSEAGRAQQTAAPLAKVLGITVTTIPSKDKDALVAKLSALNSNVLVVGHGNTIPNLVKALGISEPINIGENDYDNLFQIELGEKPKLIHLHYH